MDNYKTLVTVNWGERKGSTHFTIAIGVAPSKFIFGADLCFHFISLPHPLDKRLDIYDLDAVEVLVGGLGGLGTLPKRMTEGRTFKNHFWRKERGSGLHP